MLYSNEILALAWAVLLKTNKASQFENFYVRYKAEALPKNVTVKAFCMKNNVPWNLFDKWYRDTRHHICPVSVEGRPDETKESDEQWTDENTKPGSVAYLGLHPEESVSPT